MTQMRTFATSGSQDEAQSSSVFGMLRSIWRYKWLLLLGLTVGVSTGLVYSSRMVPEYQSSLKLLVVKKRPDLPVAGMDSRVSSMEDFLGTHQILLRSPEVISKAVKDGDLQSLPTFADGRDATNGIIGALGISRDATEVGATNILSLSFRSLFPEDCPKILNAVVKSYSYFLEKTYENVSEKTVEMITEVKQQLESGIGKKEEEYRKFRIEHPILLKGRDGINVRQERLFNFESKRSLLEIRKVEIEQKIKVVQNADKEMDRSKVLAIVADFTTPLKATSKNEADLNGLGKLQAEEEELLQEFGRDHPDVVAIRRKIERASKVSPRVEEPTGDPVQMYLDSLKRELEQIISSEQGLEEFVKTEQEKAQKQISLELQDEAYRKAIEREQEMWNGIVKRLSEMNLVKGLGGYDAKIINPAGNGARIAGKSMNVLVMSVLLGLAGGIGLAYLADLSDQSFRSAEDLRRRLQLPIVGLIPKLSKDSSVVRPGNIEGAVLAPVLCTHHAPKSVMAEAYRGVRTGLFFSTLGKGHTVIQVTSPNASDGKSTLAANLAISIAQADKTVLLIDADFRRPTQHKVFGVPNHCGFSGVLNGSMELTDAIQPSGVDRLSILPCGPIPANPAELLSLPQFKEALDHFREQYAFVIVDSPPLLAVTDPCMVAPHVDSVILTIKLSKNAKPQSLRAKEILTAHGANILGVVVNSVTEQDANYGYGYGYGYNSAYANENEQGGENKAKVKGQNPSRPGSPATS